MIPALKRPIEEDLSHLARFLRTRGVVHRVTEEGAQQVVWAVDEADAQVIQALYRDGVPEAVGPAPARVRGATAWQRTLQHIPMTLAVLAISALVAVLSRLGSDASVLVHLTFTPVTPEGRLAAYPDLAQWWRLITPIFIHFGMLHLAFNALWYWELGRRIEIRSGSLFLLGVTILFALVSNASQWLFGAPGLFGGLSGVLYGLLGYCWLYQWLCPNVHFDLPKGVVVLMLVWLVLCLSGLVTMLGFGAIANAAHVGGLVIGGLAGLIAGGLQRQRQSD
ncbi:MAG: rhomboid family intramembrane serine protease [Pseudomonadaceae bacterium]|nr:MAG: rhomboid family intramembrane serine protease [Pseudomonadaceae bacterium]